MFVALPFHHVVLGLPEITVLRAEEGAQPPEFSIASFKNLRGVLESARNRGRMKQRTHACSLEFLRPNLTEMIERKKNARHFRFWICEFGLPDTRSGQSRHPSNRSRCP